MATAKPSKTDDQAVRTSFQKDMQETFRKKLESLIEKKKNEIATIEAIEFFPKKDGSPKARFADNFGFRNLGTRGRSPWGDSYPYVSIENVHGDYFDVNTYGLTQDEAKASGLPELDGIGSRYYIPRFDPEAGKLPEAPDARKVVEFLHGKVIPVLNDQLKSLETDLADLPGFMAELIALANSHKDILKKYEGRQLRYFAMSDTLRMLDYLAY